jgi:plastocyanin
MNSKHAVPSWNVAGLLVALTSAATPAYQTPGDISARLSEWRVELSRTTVTAGSVTLTVTNAGTIPHALEVQGQGIERETGVLQPGASATLTLTLAPGVYEVYCPVGGDSHMKLGMETHLSVVSGGGAGTVSASPSHEMRAPSPSVQSIRVTGGGSFIQILPGPFPFPDSAAPILQQFGDEPRGLESQVKNGPYSG